MVTDLCHAWHRSVTKGRHPAFFPLHLSTKNGKAPKAKAKGKTKAKAKGKENKNEDKKETA